VKYTSRREAQAKAAAAQARAAREGAWLRRVQRRALCQAGAVPAGREAPEAAEAAGRPWYRQPTAGAMISAAIAAKQNTEGPAADTGRLTTGGFA
jgi:hypothetical protein